MKSIASLLTEQTGVLQAASITSARLDTELLLAHILDQSRTYLIAHATDLVTPGQESDFTTLVARRAAREPLAYLVGEKEFYGRLFTITSDVLIPRPESEAFFPILASYAPSEHDVIMDIGCGSGILGVTASLEQPQTPVIASDISLTALNVARQNAQRLNASVTFYHSDLLEDITLPDCSRFLIMANLPYVDHSWSNLSPELAYEPDLALFSDNHGLAHSLRLLEQIQSLRQPATLLLETDERQIEVIASEAIARHFTPGIRQGLISSFIYTPQVSR